MRIVQWKEHDVEYYINNGIKRKWLEEYVLLGDFIDEEDTE